MKYNAKDKSCNCIDSKCKTGKNCILIAVWIITISFLGLILALCLDGCGEYEDPLPPSYNSFNGIDGPIELPWNELDTIYLDRNTGQYQERYLCRDLGSQYFCIPLEYHSIDNKGDIDPIP